MSYIATQGAKIAGIRHYVFVGTVGVLIGIELGARFLKKIPEQTFKKVVSGIILFIGIFVLVSLK